MKYLYDYEDFVEVECDKCDEWFETLKISDCETIVEDYCILKSDLVCPTCGNIHNHTEKLIRDPNYIISEDNPLLKPQPQYTPKCPTCQSPNIEKLSVGQKVVSAGLFGLLSGRVKKTFHCNDCRYEW